MTRGTIRPVPPARRDPSILLADARRRVIVGDGAMGTQLQLAGLAPGGAGELWNVERPDAVAGIQRRYVEAGAGIILTNTFGCSRLALEKHGLGERAAELNRAGAAVARQAAGDRAWVLGDIGPFGGFLAPLGEHQPDDVYAAFLEQARALLAGGVDGILVETMSAVEEMTLAIRAARDAGAWLVGASMCFDPTKAGPRTMMGTAPADAAAAMLAAGARILGVNCGTLAFEGYVDVVRAYRAVDAGAVIMVQPNAGQPVLDEEGRTVYRQSPDALAAGLPELAAAGANIVGGCCGTAVPHIRALGRIANASVRL